MCSFDKYLVRRFLDFVRPQLTRMYHAKQRYNVFVNVKSLCTPESGFESFETVKTR